MLKMFSLLVLVSLTTLLYSAMAPYAKPQDINAILNSMTEEDLNNILTELSNMSPQELAELEKIGRQYLLDSGIDPDTGRPLEAKPAPAPEQAPKPVDVSKPIVEQPIKIQSVHNVQVVIETSINHINALRQKAHGNKEIARRLTQWADTLSDLVFYLKVIDKPVHIERLATHDFETLFKNLEALSRQLAAYQPHIILPEQSVIKDDPYTILQVPYNATDQEITQQYQKLKKRHDPKKIAQRLKAQNATQKEIDREKRAAELTFSLIQDAYDQLHDPKTKKLIDDKRFAQPTDQLSAASQQNVTKVLEAISNSVYTTKLLEQLQDFLKKYEPEQLAQKAAFDEAQTQRQKEQAELAKIQPKLTQGRFEKTDYPQELPSPARYDTYHRPYIPQEPTPTTPTAPVGLPIAPVKSGWYNQNLSGKGGSQSAKDTKGGDDTKQKLDDDKAKEQQKAVGKKTEDKEKLEIKEKLKAYEEKEQKEKADKEKLEKERAEFEKLLAPSKASLAGLRRAYTSDTTRTIMSKTRYRGVNSEFLSDAQLDVIARLPLDSLEANLAAFSRQCASNPKIKSSSYMIKEWEELTQSYGDMITRFKNQIKKEECKYISNNEDVPDKLAKLIKKLDQIETTYNTISDMLIKQKPIMPFRNCDELDIET